MQHLSPKVSGAAVYCKLTHVYLVLFNPGLGRPPWIVFGKFQVGRRSLVLKMQVSLAWKLPKTNQRQPPGIKYQEVCV